MLNIELNKIIVTKITYRLQDNSVSQTTLQMFASEIGTPINVRSRSCLSGIYSRCGQENLKQSPSNPQKCMRGFVGVIYLLVRLMYLFRS